MIEAGSTGACPNCGVWTRFETCQVRIGRGDVGESPHVLLTTPKKSWLELRFGSCADCGKLAVSAWSFPEQSAANPTPVPLWPETSFRPVPAEVTQSAPGIAADFAEAALVLPKSEKASAALSRRCLQAVLRDKGGSSKPKLVDQINEVLERVPAYIGERLHAVRVIGNLAAHEERYATGEIVDVAPEEAELQLDVLEELFDFYYVKPALATRQLDELDKKLAAANKPPLKRRGSS